MQEFNNHSRNNLYPEEEKPIDLYEIYNKFLRRRTLFFYIAIPIFLGIIIAQFTKPYTPIYRATFDLGVSNEKPVEGFFTGYEISPSLQIGTVTQRVISNLLSVRLAEKIVDTLHLYAHIKDGNDNLKVDVVLNQDFDKPLGPLKLKIKNSSGSNTEVAVYNKNKLLVQGGVGQFLDLGLFKLKVISAPVISSEKTYNLTIYPRSQVALALRNSLTIKMLEADKLEPGAKSSGVPFSGASATKKLVSANPRVYDTNIGILRINVLWANPQDALRIARTLSEQIIKQDISEKSLQYIQSRNFIESQLSQYKEKLSELEQKVKKFKENKKIADLKASTQSLITQVSQLETRKSQLQIEQKILKDLERYLSQQKYADTTINFASTLVSDPVLQNFYSQLLQTEATLRGRLKEYSSNHPKVLEVKAKLDGLKDQMKQEIAKRIPSIKTEISSVETQIALLQAKLQNVPEDEIQLARLERDKETAEKLYTFFAEKLEETKVQEAGVTSDLKIINPPIVSNTPVNSRRRLLTLFLAFVISVLAGGFAVFIAEYLDNTVKDQDLITEKLGLPIFGSIPVVEDKTKPVKKAGLAERSLRFIFNNKRPSTRSHLTILEYDLSSSELEAFRKLSLNLEFAHPEKQYQIIYVTSPGPEEGKTFVALNLGNIIARSGHNVLLLDTDFRKKKGHLTDVARQKKKEGLFDLLRSETDLESVIVPIIEDRKEKVQLDLLPIGAIPPNPFVFLESTQMKQTVARLKQKYEYIIIDGVPVLLFADATYLAKFAEAVLLTARYGKTGFKELENARDILLNARANLIGIVMNAVPQTPGSYYYHYYHKYYSKYYKKD